MKLKRFLGLTFAFLVISSNLAFANGADDIYFGAEGKFAFPVMFSGDYNIAGIGGGGAIEAGYDLSGWLLGIHGEFRVATDNGNLMKSMNNIFLTAEASRLIPLLPKKIDLRPTLGVGLNILNTEYYRNENYKAFDELTKTQSLSMLYNAGLALELPVISQRVIPYIGFDSNFSVDKKGLFTYLDANAGIRMKIGGPGGQDSFSVKLIPVKDYFTPDGDGELDTANFKVKTKYSLKTKVQSWKFEVYQIFRDQEFIIKTISGEGNPPGKITWDGTGDSERFFIFSVSDYNVRMTVTDTNGKTAKDESKISTGILVTKSEDGKFFKIRVPAITFDADAATFDTLTSRQKKANDFILRTVVKGLKKFENYNIIVQGHANNVSGTEEEEINELIPLSTLRAEAIKNQLVTLGIPAARMKAEGMGGREPIASGEESSRNRRVEFILVEK